tara:strand:+ start:1864 stop:2265 length:402 start_codon:yes stop_codon:yes gene_type:complete
MGTKVGGGMPAPQASEDKYGYEPMTFEQHSLLLEKEAELAAARDESQREFMLEQEEMRIQLEETERLQVVQEEQAIEREQMRQEQEAAGEPVTADTIQEIEGDVDDVVANMFEALLGGVEASGEEDYSEPQPE